MNTFRENEQIGGVFFLFIFLLTFATFRIYSGAVLTSGAWDLPIFLDGAWRVTQGQVVHVDFSSPLGPVTFLIGALGIKLNGLHLQSLSYGVAIFFISFTVLYYFLSHRVMHPHLSLLSSMLIGSFLITPRISGYSFTSIGYVGQYNQVGYALFFIIAILLFTPLWTEAKRESALLDFSNGAAISGLAVILLFTKITFAMTACVLIGYRLLVMRRANTTEYLIGIFFGVVLFFILFFLYFDFQISPFVRDMIIVAFSRNQSFDFAILIQVFYRCLPNILAIGVASYLLFYKIANIRKQEHRHHVLVLIIILCCGYFLTISIDQPPEFSVSALCAFYLLAISLNSLQTMKEFLLAPRRMQVSRIVFYGICIFLVTQPILSNFMGNGYALYLKMLPSKDHYSFNAVPLLDALLLKSQFKEFSVIYNDGIELLSTTTQKHERVLSVEFVNLFSFALERESPVGDLLYWHNGMTFNENVVTRFTYFKPENIFKDVKIVMIPKKHVKVEGTRAFLTLYNDYLSQHFVKLKESSYWILYRTI